MVSFSTELTLAGLEVLILDIAMDIRGPLSIAGTCSKLCMATCRTRSESRRTRRSRTSRHTRTASTSTARTGPSRKAPSLSAPTEYTAPSAA